MNTIPKPRDGATVIVVAVEGVPLTWIGPAPGTPGTGDLAGDGTPTSHALIKNAHALWADPIQVDHPSWKHPLNTTNEDAVGVLATLLHLGAGRAIIIEAPVEVTEDLFMDEDAANIDETPGQQ